MAKSPWTPLLWIVAGAAALKVLSDKQPAELSPTSQGSVSFLDELSSGAETIVKSIMGTKETDFILKMTPIADDIRALHGIQPIITISQSALESGWGLSGLTKKANNLFGFTGDSWAKEGKSVIYMPTSEWSPKPADQIQYWSTPGDILSKTPNPKGGTNLKVNRPFRAYPTWYDSVADWAHLMKMPRYAAAYKSALEGDLPAFANNVKNAGYATDPEYVAHLVNVGNSIQNA